MNPSLHRCATEELLARSRQCVHDSRVWLARFWASRVAASEELSRDFERLRLAKRDLDGRPSPLLRVIRYFFETPRSGLSEILYQLKQANLEVYGTGTFDSDSMLLLADGDVLGAELIFKRLGLEVKH